MKVYEVTSTLRLSILFFHNCDHFTNYVHLFINIECLNLNNLPLLSFSLLISCFIFIDIVICNNISYYCVNFSFQCNQLSFMSNWSLLTIKTLFQLAIFRFCRCLSNLHSNPLWCLLSSFCGFIVVKFILR